MMHPKKLAFLLAVLPLAGCETLGLSSPPPAYPDQTGAVSAVAAGPTIVAEPCPQSAVLSETSKITQLRGGGQGAGDVAVTAEMSPPRLECEYDPSTRVDNIDLTFPIMANRGPAFSGETAQITYFIALVNNAGEVIAKKTYQRTIAFEGKHAFIGTESVENLVLTLGPGTVPTDHRILVGFQLTPAQLAYNRAKSAVPVTPAPAAVVAPTPAPAAAPHARTRGRHGAPARTTATATPPAAGTTAPVAATAPAPAAAGTPAPDSTVSGTAPPAPAAPVTADDSVSRATLPSPYPDDAPDTAAAPATTPATTPAPATQPAPPPPAATTTTTPAATPATTPPPGQ